MKDVAIVESDIVAILKDRRDAEKALQELSTPTGLSQGMEDELRAEKLEQIERSKMRLRRELMQFADFPQRHVRHFERLRDFWVDGGYAKSVFIMTKFPDPDEPLGPELQRVIDAVKGAIAAAGFVPRIAQFPHNLHPGLWDNVELYLLGCRQGIAIVEDRYLPELNPNVAMEWGWMRAMGKRVLFLHEEEFGHRRADLGDLLGESFRWDDPEARIQQVVGDWLGQIARLDRG